MSEEDIDQTPLWRYVTKKQKVQGGGNWLFECNFCKKQFGGSYSRVKSHLLKISGNGIKVCTEVKPESILEMKGLVEQAESRAKASMPRNVPLPPPSPMSMTGSFSSTASSSCATMWNTEPKKRKGAEGPIEKAFKLEIRQEMHSAIARIFYTAGLPFHLARNPYFVHAFRMATSDSKKLAGYVPPGYNMLRTSLLEKEKAHVQRLLEPIRSSWKEKGVGIVSDGWSDSQRRPLINIIAISESGPMFLKAVNCEGDYKDKHFIANLLKEAIVSVGPENVVHVITDNAPVCKAAGGIIEIQYPKIFWTPCVVHTLNLALKNICAAKNTSGNEEAFHECSWIKEVVDDTVVIKNFIMNHAMRLAMYNDHVKLKMLSFAETRFASSIIMLQRFKQIKDGLQSLVISDRWITYNDDNVSKAAFVREKVLDVVWWSKITYILSFTNPIYQMLRRADTDKPCLHLVYDMWDSMIDNVRKAIYNCLDNVEEVDVSNFYFVVHEILMSRWGKSNAPLHCLAHSLNPRYYSSEWLAESPTRVAPHRDDEISRQRLKIFQRYFEGDELRQVTTEFAYFSASLKEFGSLDCMSNRWILDPHVWWITYGTSTPLLQSVAFKLLGQPCSSSCCERNWSTYSFINSLKRNKITPQRGEDLVFVHSNLRLLSRKDPQYKIGATTMWDVGGDTFDSMEGSAGILEIADLSLDEPDLERVLFDDIESIDAEVQLENDVVINV